jgi:nicotinate-nucleotide pyrophosphorylase (carboxylating)
MAHALETKATREQRTEQALFRGGRLTIENPDYRHAVHAILGELLSADLTPCDLTAKALEMEDRQACAAVMARDPGVAAGLQEIASLLRASGVTVVLEKKDGDAIRSGETLLHMRGEESKLLSFERVGLNLLQRMSGIATDSRRLQKTLTGHGFATRIVGTRKTPWGLLDKRALHLGNGGTHRLGLGDAIVIKNNHLALLASREEEAAPIAIEKAWKLRAESAFIEVEVRREAAARAAAQIFRRLQEDAGEPYPCLLMLDNMTPEETRAIVGMLRREDLWDRTLIEASGRISEANVEAYAACGVDAISIGALTHSARVLDLSQRIS